jgi:gamma-glutamyltranspeptidase/glutathione hydrolase
VRGAVSSPHRLASEIGAQVLREGGNAVDAAVATDAALCVIYPHMTSIGGDLFALVWPAGAPAPYGLAGAGPSGSEATIEAVRAAGHTHMPERGAMTVTSPGTVEAWGRLVERFGRLGLEPLLAPAASLAEEGWEVAPGVAEAMRRTADWRHLLPATWALWPSLAPGMTLRNPDLAAVLRSIGRYGYSVFALGDVANAIAGTVREGGGFLTPADVRTRASWVTPIPFSYRDLRVWEMPPPTQGLAAAGLLRRFDGYTGEDLLGEPFGGILRRARDTVYGLRDRYITDPDFSDAPREPFLDPSVDEGRAGKPVSDGDTIALTTVDEEGTLVSMIQSVSGSFGSGVVARGTGILLQNRGSYFSLDEGHVNRLEPRKRTLHTLIPAMAQGRDRRIAFGTMGGDGQPQLQAQVLLQLTDGGRSAQEAVAAPRVRAADATTIWVEADHPHARAWLRSLPGAVPLAPGDVSFGHASAIVATAGGTWDAGADPRSDGAVARSPH